MGERDWARLAWIALGAILVLRVISLWFNTTELFFDEAQYWVWGKEPAFGYFSKPPVLAWIIGLVTGVCGDSEFCVRLASPIIHTGTAFVVFLIAGMLFDRRTAFWSAFTYALLPAVSLSSGVISTDVPLLFFWALALYAFLKFERTNAAAWAVMLGVAIGLGVMSKYAMLYILPCIALYSLSIVERPHVLARGRFWLAMAIAALIVAPNIWWNYVNQFATVGHTGENIGWGGKFPNVGGFAEFAASQFAVMGPLMFGIYVASVFRLPREGMTRAQWFLIAFSAPVLATILLQALMSKAYANWAALTYVAGTILAVEIMLNRLPQWWLRVSTSIHAVVFAVLLVAVAFSRPGELPLPEGADPFARMHGAKEVASEARAKISQGDYQAILVDERQMAALMHYYLRDLDLPIKSWQRGRAPDDHFELTRPYQDQRLSPVFYITRNNNPARVVSNFVYAERLAVFKPDVPGFRKVSFYTLRGPAPAAQ
ncbi:MAG TPA: glycosyltransferase family 39 protein [Rhizobiaceae bacterium]|nr:glycosyltransferase family 39 protein [Rhizobiaceae bacterium]